MTTFKDQITLEDILDVFKAYVACIPISVFEMQAHIEEYLIKKTLEPCYVINGGIYLDV